jgi:DNA-binding response OmpR family regulator
LNDKDTILIVDDSLDNLNLLFEGLRRAGYEVMVAQDGASVLKRVESLKPDLILLDVMMPGMDGFETAVRLKAQESSRDIPIIFLTALNETAHIVKGFEVGGVDYLVKPLRMEEALARINTHLSLRKSQSQLKARTRELTALLELSHNLVSTLDLERLANLILNQLKTVVDYTGCVLLTTTAEGKLSTLAYRGLISQEEIPHECLFDKILRERPTLFDPPQPLLIADVRADERLRRFFEPEAEGQDLLLPTYTRAWMGVPLVLNQQIIGG